MGAKRQPSQHSPKHTIAQTPENAVSTRVYIWCLRRQQFIAGEICIALCKRQKKCKEFALKLTRRKVIFERSDDEKRTRVNRVRRKTGGKTVRNRIRKTDLKKGSRADPRTNDSLGKLGGKSPKHQTAKIRGAKIKSKV